MQICFPVYGCWGGSTTPSRGFTIDEYVLYVIRDGNMYLQEDGIFYHLKAGDFFLLEPGLCHEGYQRAACNYYYAHFTHPEMARMKDEDAAMALLAEKRRLSLVSYNLDEADPTDPITYLPKQFHLPGSEFNTILRTALDCYNAREEHYKRRTAALLHSFFLEVAHEHLLARGAAQGKKLKKSEVVAERLLHYLNENYIGRLFRRQMGVRFTAYLNQVRIAHARTLLLDTSLSVTEIAMKTGFNQVPYFNRCFKANTGMTPTAFRVK